jgi:lactate dehydrogenase-like 2-hydroxyacid dehydrogenase
MTNTKPVLLQLLPFPFQDLQDTLAENYNVIQLWKAEDREATLAQNAEQITVMTTSAMTATPAELIDRLPNLKAICSFGVGYDAIDVAHAQSRGIQVSNTPEVLNDCVADTAFSLLLATARRISQGERYVRSNLWGSGQGFPLGTSVSHKKLGIVGLGRIGMAIAQRATGFNMDIRYYNRNQRNDVSYGYATSLVELAQWADFLVVATVGGPSTRHLVNADVLNALGPKGIIVNISRGSVIDEQALVQALQEGRLGGAGLDVFENEPKVPDELKSLDNAVLIPHIGSATGETRRAMAALVLENALSWAKQGKLVTPIPAV